MLTRRKAIEVVAGLIWDKDKFLICQRPENKARGLLWEFPGGKVEAGETLPQALQRECMEELAVKLDVRDRFMQVEHKYPDIFIRLTLFHCVISGASRRRWNTTPCAGFTPAKRKISPSAPPTRIF